VIAVCAVLGIVLAWVMVKLWLRALKFAASAVLLILLVLAAVIWFFSSFQIKLM
jgi:hypothetical protein